jgi:hypothetical protein
MTCKYEGEIKFPVPFSIIAVLISLGLLVARFMKNGTRFFITMLALVDWLLKINWIILDIFLFKEKHYISGGVILYCILATFLINILIWRKLYYKYQIDKDP